jgi:topoisomerase-4 subunit B
MRLQPVILTKDSHLIKLLEFYMGKNTPNRQDFIIDNLRMEIDVVEKEKIEVEA